MNNHKIKYLMVITVGILVVSAMALTKSRRTNHPTSKAQQETKQTFDTLPLIISQVKDVEAVKATLKNPGTPDAYAVLEIKNNSDKAIIAISVDTGKPEEANGIAIEGFRDDGLPPSVIIKPHDSIPVIFSLGNIKAGDPIRISSVLYADNSADGEKTALETVHTFKKNRESKTAKQKPYSNESRSCASFQTFNKESFND